MSECVSETAVNTMGQLAHLQRRRGGGGGGGGCVNLPGLLKAWHIAMQMLLRGCNSGCNFVLGSRAILALGREGHGVGSGAHRAYAAA